MKIHTLTGSLPTLHSTQKLSQARHHFSGNLDGRYDHLFRDNECKDGYGVIQYNGINREPDAHVLDVMKNYVKPGQAILELGCNAGDNLLNLAQNGYRMFGLDISTRGLTTLKEKASKLTLAFPPEVARWDFGENGDVPPAWKSKFKKLEGAFQAIYAVHVLSHFNDQKLVEMMQNLKKYLAPGGIILSTIVIPYKNMPFHATPALIKQGWCEHSAPVLKKAFKGLNFVPEASGPFELGRDKLFFGLPREQLRWQVYQKPLPGKKTNKQFPPSSIIAIKSNPDQQPNPGPAFAHPEQQPQILPLSAAVL